MRGVAFDVRQKGKHPANSTSWVTIGSETQMRPKLVITALSLAFLTLPSVAQPAWDLVTSQQGAHDRAAAP